MNKNIFDPLFKSDNDYHNNACINWSHDPLELYIKGYKEAADSLVNKVIKTKTQQDTLVYPICFLYRQYIELRLKEIIRTGRELLDEGRSFPQHHKIKTLWPTAKTILNEVYKDDTDSPDLLFVEHIIMEFSSLDPESFAFRYPFDKFGVNPLEGIYHINLRHLYDCINNFSEVIESASTGMSVYLDFKRDMESGI
ncbi:MAG: hypothetical protein OEU95_06100 [Nitrospirota bacterium]|nr:hypothetical protein [Nitrospirota bacterium]